MDFHDHGIREGGEIMVSSSAWFIFFAPLWSSILISYLFYKYAKI